MPLAMGKLFTHPTLNWGLYTEPEGEAQQPTYFWPRGKVSAAAARSTAAPTFAVKPRTTTAGGGSATSGWGWSDVLPYFQKAGAAQDLHGLSANGKGMLTVNYPVYVRPIARAFIEAGVRAGLPATNDRNGTVSEGVSLMPNSVRRGVRQSSVETYLRPASKRRNLTRRDFGIRSRVAFRGHAGQQASSTSTNGKIQKAVAAREVSLSPAPSARRSFSCSPALVPAGICRSMG